MNVYANVRKRTENNPSVPKYPRILFILHVPLARVVNIITWLRRVSWRTIIKVPYHPRSRFERFFEHGVTRVNERLYPFVTCVCTVGGQNYTDYPVCSVRTIPLRALRKFLKRRLLDGRKTKIDTERDVRTCPENDRKRAIII